MERLAWKRVPPVAIWEKSGQWATWWRGLRSSTLPWSTPRVVEARSATEFRAVLDAETTMFGVLELAPQQIDAVLELLGMQERRWPQAAFVVVAERTMSAWEPLVREAGALAWCTSPRRLQSLVEMAARYARRYAAPYDSVCEAVTASLPWR